MKKLLILLATTLMLVASCSQPNEGNTTANTAVTDATAIMKDVMMTRRSIRQYHDYRISRDTLDLIMELGVNAPNGMNRQAYEVRVVDDPALVKEISDAVVAENPQIGDRPGFRNIFVNAPCVVFIATDHTYDLSAIDCGLMCENMILSAWSMGIGSCCLGAPVRMLRNSQAAAPYMQRLGFSAGYELQLCLALGYPQETPAARPRQEGKVLFVE